ncbi:IucA/IucC [Novosphingobium sp. Rr 2-17]|uniref:hypothetical protein n=1 Tax=Novosphingobium sp. Rr 2-17 TaxID=555793 RepID=UPI0002697BDC|nr:hypothetical protein [Novosphingobium sp. Rr 2-17]EIZ77134.1 IucA/IucC [Novosphingobium sp. Rr 2-17]
MLLTHWEKPEVDKEGVHCVADAASCRALFNCVVREVALPGGLARYEWPAAKGGLAVLKQQKQGVPLHLMLPGGSEYFVLVDRRDALGSHRYLSDIWALEHGKQRWRQADLLDLARGAVAGGVDQDSKGELLDQIVANRDTLTEILRETEATMPDPLADYVTSERIGVVRLSGAPSAQSAALGGSTR